MSENKGPEVKTQQKGSGVKTFLTITVIVLVGVLAVKWYLDVEEREEMKTFYESELEISKDRLAEISEELDEKILEIERLGGEVDDLKAAKAEVEAERDQLEQTRTANRQLITDLRDRTEGYQELLRAKDEEIVKLKEINQELLTENVTLKEEKNELSRSIGDLNEDKEELEGKVAIASRLQAEEIRIIAVSSRGKEKEEESFRRRQINDLKVTFKIAKNDVAPIEGKDILLRIIDENDQVYFDVAKGSGTFMLDGKEVFYTAHQNLLFDNSNQEVSFLYNKGSEYNLGTHTVEIFTDGYLMGKQTFTVR